MTGTRDLILGDVTLLYIQQGRGYDWDQRPYIRRRYTSICTSILLGVRAMTGEVRLGRGQGSVVVLAVVVVGWWGGGGGGAL